MTFKSARIPKIAVAALILLAGLFVGPSPASAWLARLDAPSKAPVRIDGVIYADAAIVAQGKVIDGCAYQQCIEWTALLEVYVADNTWQILDETTGVFPPVTSEINWILKSLCFSDTRTYSHQWLATVRDDREGPYPFVDASHAADSQLNCSVELEVV